jgi:hypothetical protein
MKIGRECVLFQLLLLFYNGGQIAKVKTPHIKLNWIRDIYKKHVNVPHNTCKKKNSYTVTNQCRTRDEAHNLKTKDVLIWLGLSHISRSRNRWVYFICSLFGKNVEGSGCNLITPKFDWRNWGRNQKPPVKDRWIPCRDSKRSPSNTSQTRYRLSHLTLCGYE